MSKTKISQYSAVASDNTDVNGININEGCPPSSMNNMGREIMAALKRFQVGSDGDGVTVGGNLVVSGTATVTSGSINGTTVGATTPATGSFTTLNTSGQVVFNDAGADVDFRVEGDTDANLLFVDASTDRVGIGTSSPAVKLDVVGQVRASTGILFGSDTAAANALDDYEEGTWTFAATTTGGSVTMDASTNTCWYLKIGRLVSVGGEVVVDSVSSPTGAIIVTLPFAAANLTQNAEFNAGSIFVNNSASKNARDFAVLTQGGTEMRIYIADASTLSSANANAQQLQAATGIQFQISYYASA